MSIELVASQFESKKFSPREKIVNSWIEYLDDIELLSVIFWTWYKNMNVRSLSQYLLNNFWMKWVFQFRSLKDIQESTGLPFVKSCLLLAIWEFIKRITNNDNSKIKSPEQLYAYIKDNYKKTNFEKLIIVCLDNQRRVLYSWAIAQWESNTLRVSLSSIFHHPFRLNSKNFYLIHNHPNWVSKASEDDICFSLKLKKECDKYWILFDDHIIIWNDGFYSFSLNWII